jgi:hypothetical protein
MPIKAEESHGQPPWTTAPTIRRKTMNSAFPGQPAKKPETADQERSYEFN